MLLRVAAVSAALSGLLGLLTAPVPAPDDGCRTGATGGASSCSNRPTPTPGLGSDQPTRPAQPAAVLKGTARVPGSPVTSVTPTPPPPPGCQALAGTLSLADQVGQLFMVGVSSPSVSTTEAKALRASRAGSVIFLGTNRSGVAGVKALSGKVRRAGVAPGRVRMMVTVDQEGGLVQRLRGPGFSQIPSARDQAKVGDRLLQQKAQTWARQLRSADVDANLAPVTDVVPTSLEQTNKPIGVLHRDYGPNPAVVARKASAFVKGMKGAGVVTAVKHFPGLGRVRGNTDYERRVVDTTTRRHDPALRGFRSGVTSGADMVMVSSAFYSRIDPTHRATYSSYIIGQMIRRDLEFGGVVVSDDLGTRAMRFTTPGHRAMLFLQAGGDLVIVGDPTQAVAMTKVVIAQAKASRLFAHQVTIKAGLVLRMKSRHELAPRCI